MNNKIIFGIEAVLFTLILALPIEVFNQTIEHSYAVNEEAPIGGSATFYASVSNVPAGAIITNVQAKFDYIAYNGAQNYVSGRFNKVSESETSEGTVQVAQENLPQGNPGIFGNVSFSSGNGQFTITTNYYFRFSVASESPYTYSINKIFDLITYSLPLKALNLVSPINNGTLTDQPYQFTLQELSMAGANHLKITDNSYITDIHS